VPYMNRYIGSLFLAAAIAAPTAIMAHPRPQGGSVQVRIYDRDHRDYHDWDNREDRAYRRYHAATLLELAPQPSGPRLEKARERRERLSSLDFSGQRRSGSFTWSRRVQADGFITSGVADHSSSSSFPTHNLLVVRSLAPMWDGSETLTTEFACLRKELTCSGIRCQPATARSFLFAT
jgi:hypothetical protein